MKPSRFTVKKRKSSPKKSRFTVRTLEELFKQNPQLYQMHMNQKRKKSPKQSRFNVRTLEELSKQNPQLYELHKKQIFVNRNTY